MKCFVVLKRLVRLGSAEVTSQFSLASVEATANAENIFSESQSSADNEDGEAWEEHRLVTALKKGGLKSHHVHVVISFVRQVSPIMQRAFKPESIKKGLKMTGVRPLNLNRILQNCTAYDQVIKDNTKQIALIKKFRDTFVRIVSKKGYLSDNWMDYVGLSGHVQDSYLRRAIWRWRVCVYTHDHVQAILQSRIERKKRIRTQQVAHSQRKAELARLINGVSGKDAVPRQVTVTQAYALLLLTGTLRTEINLVTYKSWALDLKKRLAAENTKHRLLPSVEKCLADLANTDKGKDERRLLAAQTLHVALSQVCTDEKGSFHCEPHPQFPGGAPLPQVDDDVDSKLGDTVSQYRRGEFGSVAEDTDSAASADQVDYDAVMADHFQDSRCHCKRLLWAEDEKGATLIPAHCGVCGYTLCRACVDADIMRLHSATCSMPPCQGCRGTRWADEAWEVCEPCGFNEVGVPKVAWCSHCTTAGLPGYHKDGEHPVDEDDED
jgi:hypothetical protein